MMTSIYARFARGAAEAPSLTPTPAPERTAPQPSANGQRRPSDGRRPSQVAYDVDADGKLDVVEQTMRKYDTNGDGKFSMPEVKAIVADVVSARKDERNLKVLSGILAVSIIVLIGSMFAAAYLASTVSKEVFVDERTSVQKDASGGPIRLGGFVVPVLTQDDRRRRRMLEVQGRRLVSVAEVDQAVVDQVKAFVEDSGQSSGTVELKSDIDGRRRRLTALGLRVLREVTADSLFATGTLVRAYSKTVRRGGEDVLEEVYDIRGENGRLYTVTQSGLVLTSAADDLRRLSQLEALEHHRHAEVEAARRRLSADAPSAKPSADDDDAPPLYPCVVYHCFAGDAHCAEPAEPSRCLAWDTDNTTCLQPACAYASDTQVALFSAASARRRLDPIVGRALSTPTSIPCDWATVAQDCPENWYCLGWRGDPDNVPSCTPCKNVFELNGCNQSESGFCDVQTYPTLDSDGNEDGGNFYYGTCRRTCRTDFHCQRYSLRLGFDDTNEDHHNEGPEACKHNLVNGVDVDANECVECTDGDKHCTKSTCRTHEGYKCDCFPAHATVTTPAGPKRMDEIAAGDRVLVDGAGTFSTVYFESHKDRRPVRHAYVRLELSSGHALELSSEHLAIADGAYTAAAHIRVGMAMRTAGGVGAPDGAPTEALVVAKTVVYREGLYAPVTLHGDIVVDGIVASSYSNLLARLLPHSAAARNDALANALAHFASAPLRAVFALEPDGCALFMRTVSLTESGALDPFALRGPGGMLAVAAAVVRAALDAPARSVVVRALALSTAGAAWAAWVGGVLGPYNAAVVAADAWSSESFAGAAIAAAPTFIRAD